MRGQDFIHVRALSFVEEKRVDIRLNSRSFQVFRSSFPAFLITFPQAGLYQQTGWADLPLVSPPPLLLQGSDASVSAATLRLLTTGVDVPAHEAR